MGSTFFSLHYHIVFSTKDRRPFIKPEWRPRLHAYLGGIIKGMNGVPEIVGGVEDHVHVLGPNLQHDVTYAQQRNRD